MSKQTITVTVESAPHAEDLVGVMLTRPAPSGGSFLIDQRVERAVWDQMKAAGARYYSRDDLEDFDMFDAEPGWRYRIEALRILLRAGFTLHVCGQDVGTAEELDALFSAQGQAAYKARRAADKAERERKARDAKEQKQRDDAEKEAAYASWKATHLAGLVRTYANDHVLSWERVAHFDGPGTWYTTGDTWYKAEVEGHVCYQCHYGNAIASYAPQAIADLWCDAHWRAFVRDVYNGDQSAAARQVLIDSLRDYIGSDVAKRLIEIHGPQFFAQLAGATEWWIYGKDMLDWAGQAARHYGVQHVYLTAINTGSLPFTTGRFHLPDSKLVQSYWRHPDGRIIAKGYRENETAVVNVADLPPSIQKLINS